MSDALKTAGRPVEMLFIDEGGHNLSSQRGRLAAFTAIVEFLEKHLGPGVEYRPGT